MLKQLNYLIGNVTVSPKCVQQVQIVAKMLQLFDCDLLPGSSGSKSQKGLGYEKIKAGVTNRRLWYAIYDGDEHPSDGNAATDFYECNKY